MDFGMIKQMSSLTSLFPKMMTVSQLPVSSSCHMPHSLTRFFLFQLFMDEGRDALISQLAQEQRHIARMTEIIAKDHQEIQAELALVQSENEPLEKLNQIQQRFSRTKSIETEIHDLEDHLKEANEIQTQLLSQSGSFEDSAFEKIEEIYFAFKKMKQERRDGQAVESFMSEAGKLFGFSEWLD
jgi:septal ring factor EnvC (AmiA/AmiB activator)